MHSNSKLPEIQQDAFSKARESLGLTLQELAGKACLSIRQIEQIENGEQSSFYGAQNKLTAAKKVATILGLSDNDAFEHKKLIEPVTRKKEVPQVAEKADLPVAIAEVVVEKRANKVQESKEKERHKESSPGIQKGYAPLKLGSIRLADTYSARSVSSNASSKRLILLLSIAAGLAFAGINLYKTVFLAKPEPIQPVTQEGELATPSSPSVPAEVAAVTPVPVASGAPAEVCPGADASIVSYKPEVPRKAADMVFIQAKSQQYICVVDASGKSQGKMMERGVGASFYGKPPFKVLTSGLGQVDLYFQGAKVRPERLTGKTLLLEPADLVQAQPSSSSDAQLR